MKKKITLFIALIFLTTPFILQAQGTYYNNVEVQVANGLNCMPLKQALHDLIDGHTVRSYGDVNSFMCAYDTDASGNVLDRYKGNNVPCSGGGLDFSLLNREHVLPRSWWGGSTSVTQYTDFHNLFPSDVQANSDKSGYPLGEVGSSIGNYPCPSFPFTDIGLDGLSCTNINAGTNFDDNVFEPDNSYKGDFARVYLYMAVRYQDEIISGNWKGTNSTTFAVFSNDILTIYEPCLLALMLQWHNQDPPSQLEIDRNNAIALASNQGNRNPFIDHPEYADLIWNATCTGNPPPPEPLCETTLNNCDWTPVSVTTNSGSQPTWSCTAGSYDINAFTNSNNPSEQWLVYGPVDITGTSVANLVLDIVEGFSGPELEFLWNATSNNPTAAGWNSVDMAGNATVSGYSVNYSSAIGNSAVYLGIKYTATGAAGGTHSFTLSNFRYQESCCAGVDLAINFDAAPQQTAWEILDDSGNIVASSTDTYSGTSVLETACLADGCYSLVVTDSGNDGMCPRRTSTVLTGINIASIGLGGVFNGIPRVAQNCGDYTLTDANGTVLASGGGRFGSSETSVFCIAGGVAELVAPSNGTYSKSETYNEDIQLQIIPNMAQDQINVYYSNSNENAEIYIVDVNGRVLSQHSTNRFENNIQLNVSDLQAGYYFVQMISINGVIAKKFVKI